METSSKFSASTLFPFFSCSATDLHNTYTHAHTQTKQQIKKGHINWRPLPCAFIDFKYFFSKGKTTEGGVHHKYDDDDDDDAVHDDSDDNDDDIETDEGSENHTIAYDRYCESSLTPY